MPLAVLRAVALTETGRMVASEIRPWPWSVNSGGESHWFPTRAAAEAFVAAASPDVLRNIDIGCFQINQRWHGHAFANALDIFDPWRNAHYAANFLASLHREFGDWRLAAGAYHSRTPGLAARYLARFDRHLFGSGAPPTAARDRAPDRAPNGGGGSIGFLSGGRPPAPGSLVSLRRMTSPLIVLR